MAGSFCCRLCAASNLLVTGAVRDRRAGSGAVTAMVRWLDDQVMMVLSQVVDALARCSCTASGGRETVQYPEQKPLPARRAIAAASSSRAIRTAQERCVACNLCAVACPVDCIALEKTEDETGRWYPALVPHQLLALHLLRLLRGGLPDVRDPADPRLRDERVRPAQHGIREGGPADRRHRQSIPTTTSSAWRAWRSAARTRARPRTKRRPSTCAD